MDTLAQIKIDSIEAQVVEANARIVAWRGEIERLERFVVESQHQIELLKQDL